MILPCAYNKLYCYAYYIQISKYIDGHIVKEITQGLIGRDKIIIYRVLVHFILDC